ncbi:FAD-binding oxidoreductase [Pseudonocardia sp. N23]|uniref:FAD-binding oxidoreductase n=1 Tax=Pseudonocardia sp. N23 TaxID=1987376 RepID=UPI000BFDF1CA|nr:FAD-binding protein [Pseudonocardia sp. N23]GAY07817.1 glycolate dehydrogenase, FAD-binding subunit GlcE [Pseudonocardia sp. N23]
MPPTTHSPRDVDELRDVVADTMTSHPRLLVTAAGTAATTGGRPDPADAVVDTTALSGILGYTPADMTVAVRAGTPLADIQAELGEHGQHIAFDAARIRRGATVGGLLASGDGGPLRQLYGTLRDLVIGVTVVLGDGTVAKSGGHVIKNVAGYDLAKLFHSSLGTLGVVGEVVLRVHPLPRRAATVALPADAAAATRLGVDLIASGTEPVALEWTPGTGLLVRLEGTPDGVGERVDAVLGRNAAARVLSGDDEEAAWSAVATVADPSGRDVTVLRAGTLPSDGPAFLAALGSAADAAGVTLAAGSSVGQGVHTVALTGGRHEPVLAAAHAAAGSSVSVLRHDGLDPATPLWGPPPPAVAVMRAVKARFDPAGRFGSGRLSPWLAPAPAREGVPA